MQLPKAAMCLSSQKHSSILQEKALHFFLLNQPLHASCVSPGDLDLVATLSERSLGCSHCCVERKWFFFSDLVTRRERERGGRGGGGGAEIEQNLPLARSRQYYPSMRAGPPKPGPSRAAARDGMKAVMTEYEVFVLQAHQQFPVRVLFCLTFVLRFFEDWIELLFLALLSITLSVVIFLTY